MLKDKLRRKQNCLQVYMMEKWHIVAIIFERYSHSHQVAQWDVWKLFDHIPNMGPRYFEPQNIDPKMFDPPPMFAYTIP